MGGADIKPIEVYYKLNRFRMITGISLCAVGIVLMILGNTGSITWILEAGSIKSKLLNGSPGAFVFLVGAFLVWFTSPKIRIESRKTIGSVNTTENVLLMRRTGSHTPPAGLLSHGTHNDEYRKKKLEADATKKKSVQKIILYTLGCSIGVPFLSQLFEFLIRWLSK